MRASALNQTWGNSMNQAEDRTIKAAQAISTGACEVIETTMRSDTIIEVTGRERVVLSLPDFVSWFDVYFSVQKLVDGVWQYGNVGSEQVVKEGREDIVGRRVSLPQAGTYKLIQEWKVYRHLFKTKLPDPVTISVAGRHPKLKAFNIVELGSAKLFERYDPLWLLYGRYAYLVKLTIPAQFNDNIHIHFGQTLDILLRDSTQDQNTWLNVLADGSTLLVWDQNCLQILLDACENSLAPGNVYHQVTADVSAMVFPEAVWGPKHE